jgi:hypothetical protein
MTDDSCQNPLDINRFFHLKGHCDKISKCPKMLPRTSSLCQSSEVCNHDIHLVAPGSTNWRYYKEQASPRPSRRKNKRHHVFSNVSATHARLSNCEYRSVFLTFLHKRAQRGTKGHYQYRPPVSDVSLSWLASRSRFHPSVHKSSNLNKSHQSIINELSEHHALLPC